ncbi:MAG: YegP family protein [Syntrophales bacterium]
MAVKFEIFKDGKGEFRWRLVVSNGQIVATAGEGYKSKESARAGIESVKKNAPVAEVEDMERLPG